jgi:hypothetical protein
MTAAIDLNGKIKSALNGAYARGFPVSVAYVDGDGKPHVSLRGSVQVVSSTEIGLWARKRDDGLVRAIEANPNVALLFFGNLPDGSRLRAAFNGRARSDPARNREIYDAMGEVEQNYDPDAKGVAVIVAIETVAGMTEEGPFRMCHESA